MVESNNEKTIFIVDDNDTNLLTAENALIDYYNVLTLSSATGMFDLLKCIKPDLILLDIVMPVMDGFEAMKKLKSNDSYASIPVIFLTGKKDETTEAAVFEMGAVDFISKPIYIPVLLKRIKLHLDMEGLVRERTALATKQTALANERAEKLERLQNGMVSVLANMVESRDKYTGKHIERTTMYIKILLEAMIDNGVYTNEIKEWKINSVVSSARLHDIGKVVISDLLLNKQGKFTDEEFEIMKTHASEGEKIIDNIIAKSGDGAFLHSAKLFASSHHERWNGTGYPYGLSGENIPLQGRIMAIADVYDALVSERPYKKPFSHEKAIAIITEDSGKHFDPKMVKVFLKVSDKFEEVSTCQTLEI